MPHLPRLPRLSHVIAAATLVLAASLTGCDAPPPQPVQPIAQGAVPYGSYCSAGFYTCPAQGPIGSPCACPGLGAPSYGSIH